MTTPNPNYVDLNRSIPIARIAMLVTAILCLPLFY
jgi:hypothetical protein